MSFQELRLEAGVPIYLQIARHLKAGIAAGTVRDGEEMPSRRVLSALLGVNPNTVQKAYRQLEAAGLIRSRPGSGSCVSADGAAAAAVREELAVRGAAALAAQLKAMGMEKDEALSLLGSAWDREEEA